MQYLVYFLVATPLLVGWLFWEADRPPQPPLFQSGIEALQTRAAPPVAPAVAPNRVARNTAAPRNE
jgi:hypothetical protein